MEGGAQGGAVDRHAGKYVERKQGARGPFRDAAVMLEGESETNLCKPRSRLKCFAIDECGAAAHGCFNCTHTCMCMRCMHACR